MKRLRGSTNIQGRSKQIRIRWICCGAAVGLLALGFGISEISFAQTTSSATRSTLKAGSNGSEVSELQATLKLLGYFDGTVDGVFGSTTSTAVSRFQQAAGLNQDGVVGPATWDRLFPPNPPSTGTTATVSATTASATNGSPSNVSTTNESTTTVQSSPARSRRETPSTTAFPLLKRGARGPAVAGLQERLRAIGLFEGESDGVFGAATEEAVKAAQEKSQLDPDGVVGPSTWTAIMR